MQHLVVSTRYLYESLPQFNQRQTESSQSSAGECVHALCLSNLSAQVSLSSLVEVVSLLQIAQQTALQRPVFAYLIFLDFSGPKIDPSVTGRSKNTTSTPELAQVHVRSGIAPSPRNKDQSAVVI